MRVFRKVTKYLGHVENERDVSPDPNKIKCIKEYPRSKNVKDIKSFLGFIIDDSLTILQKLQNL